MEKGIIVCFGLRTIPHVEYFLTLNKLYKTTFVNFFSIEIGLLPFSLVIRETSTILVEIFWY